MRRLSTRRSGSDGRAADGFSQGEREVQQQQHHQQQTCRQAGRQAGKDQGQGREGGQVACRHQADENILTFPTYLTVIPQLAATASFIHTDSPTNLPTYLLTNLPTNLRVRSPPRPSERPPSDCSLTLTCFNSLDRRLLARHAYSPPRGDTTSTTLLADYYTR